MSILDDFITINTNGIYCKYGDFYLDPQQPVQRAVISHAHADHAVSGNRDVYCTLPTREFMYLRYNRSAAQLFNIVDCYKPFAIKDVKLTYLPAGHMLGSAMILMEYAGASYLYTGDYKIQADSTCEPISWVQADVLITETTFANPDIIHPDPVEEIKKLNAIKSNILLGAYGLGKSQRLLRMINDYAPQKKVLVHHKILPVNQIYQRHGVDLGKHQLYGRKLMKTQEEFVYIVPPFTFNSYIKATGVKRLFASGWKNLQVNHEDTLFISDHVDWNDILHAIKMVNPKQVWTLHGDGKHLKAHLSGNVLVKVLN